MTQEKLTPALFIGVNGNGYISFGSGQPDLPPPEEVFKILPTYRDFRYGLIQGQLNLRKELAKQFAKATADNIVITNGASEALDLTFKAIAKPGEKVLIHQPYYYSYPPILENDYLKPVFTQTTKGKIDIEDFDTKVRDCKAVLINSPSNPTGTVQEINTLKQIEQLCKDLDITIVSDEVYKDLIYTRENYMLSGDHVITINSFSKTFAMCGLRVGYLYSNDPKIVERVVDIKTHSSMNTSILSQEMAYHATKVPKSYITEQTKIWEQRRDVIYNGLVKLGLDLWKPEGAFYVFPKVKNPKKTVMDLFKKHKVITYLGEWFGDNNRIRLSYALDIDKIEEGLKRIGKYLES